MVLQIDTLKELEVGKTYSARELWYFLNFNDATILSEDAAQFTDSEDFKFRVIDCKETFVHSVNDDQVYIIPNSKRKVYIIEKI
ncbi:MAG: hypothetical protein ACOYI2_06490 [Bacillota bacterium]|jgi:hypothetical protein